MDTPICDFINEYAKNERVRFHMPGHKGVGGELYKFDLTEIDGADSLYHSDGIIEKSRQNACKIFGADTYYACEGCSQAIRAMLHIAAVELGAKKILAARNAHKSFVSAAALLGLEVEWLYQIDGSYLSCEIDEKYLESQIIKTQPNAVYLTTPDYLGNTLNVKALSKVCKKHGVLLLVDNAHGAYLKFLTPTQHPIDLGADMCCDSAHKTLPALTGTAYLHANDNLKIEKHAILNALSLYGSTSPSYLLLCSLDKINPYLESQFGKDLEEFINQLTKVKVALKGFGYELIEKEPLKITISTKPYGYTGGQLNQELKAKGIVSEFYDNDYLVLMASPQNDKSGLQKLVQAMQKIEKKTPIKELPPKQFIPTKKMDIRAAALKKSVILPVEQCEGKVLLQVSVSCPPAVPILVCGEVVDKRAIECFKYYGVKSLAVAE